MVNSQKVEIICVSCPHASYLLQDDIAYLGVYVIFQGRRYNGLKVSYKLINEGIICFRVMEMPSCMWIKQIIINDSTVTHCSMTSVLLEEAEP